LCNEGAQQMSESITPEGRTATGPDEATRPVTLINRFVVPDGRDEVFQHLWTETSRYFRAQPGFVSLRLHRAVTPDARYRFVNVAQWASAAQYRAPHLSDEFRHLITQQAWREFPSTPTLYEIVAAADRAPVP
jgi:heme-degrading monooxygenase HmoA